METKYDIFFVADADAVVADLVRTALESTYAELVEDSDRIDDFTSQTQYNIKYNFVSGYHRLTGISVHPVLEDILEPVKFANTLCRQISTLSQVAHVVKLYDSQLLQSNLQYSQKIFAMEMKLREVATVIFNDELQPTNFQRILENTTTSIQGKPDVGEMESNYENDFFHVLFGAYASCNSQKEAKDFASLKSLIDISIDFDAFKSRLTKLPINYSVYTSYINDLKNVMEPLEAMRNCVMHNRTPSNKIITNFETSEEKLNIIFDNIFDYFQTKGNDDVIESLAE